MGQSLVFLTTMTTMDLSYFLLFFSFPSAATVKNAAKNNNKGHCHLSYGCGHSRRVHKHSKNTWLSRHGLWNVFCFKKKSSSQELAQAEEKDAVCLDYGVYSRPYIFLWQVYVFNHTAFNNHLTEVLHLFELFFSGFLHISFMTR